MVGTTMALSQGARLAAAAFAISARIPDGDGMVLKVRRNQSPAPPRGCAVTECMDLLGGAWTANIVWYLAGGPRRFSELRGDLAPITARVLTRRLRELEARGVLLRHRVNSSPPTVEYALTEIGEELRPALHAIVEVGLKLKARSAQHGSATAQSHRLATPP
jgi:DNA-binding HxlR family transcriptional regulator